MQLTSQPHKLLISNDNKPRYFPGIARLGYSKFVVCWIENNKNIKAQIFISDGKELSFFDKQMIFQPILVSEYSNYIQKNAVITNFNEDRFIIAFNSKKYESGANKGTIYARIFNQFGKAITNDLMISSDNIGNPDSFPAVAALGPNNMLITWEETYQNHPSLLAKIINTEGKIIVPEFAIDDELQLFNNKPAAIAVTDQNFIVTWSRNLSSVKNNIILQRFDFNGHEVTSKIVITLNHQKFHSILLNNQKLAILWEVINENQYATICSFDLIDNKCTQFSPLLLTNDTQINDLYDVVKVNDKYLVTIGHSNKGLSSQLVNYQTQQIEHSYEMIASHNFHPRLLKFNDQSLLVVSDLQQSNIIANIIELTDKPIQNLITTTTIEKSLPNKDYMINSILYKMLDVPYLSAGFISGVIAYHKIHPLLIIAPIYALTVTGSKDLLKIVQFEAEKLPTSQKDYLKGKLPNLDIKNDNSWPSIDIHSYALEALAFVPNQLIKLGSQFSVGMFVGMAGSMIYVNYPKITKLAIFGAFLYYITKPANAEEIAIDHPVLDVFDSQPIDFLGNNDNEYNI